VLYSDCKVPRVPRRTGAAPETFHSAASGSQVPMLIKYLVYYLVYSKVRGPSVDARVDAFIVGSTCSRVWGCVDARRT